MKQLTNRVCHTDVPVPEPDGSDFLRKAASESCGYNPNVDAFEANRQVQAGGGPEKIVDRAARRARGER